MPINNLVKFVVAVIVSEIAGVIGATVTIPAISEWYSTLARPAYAPPDWLFGPVWTGLYFLIGVSLYLVWKNNWKITVKLSNKTAKAWNPWSEQLWSGDWQKANVIAVFTAQYILNIAWTWTFFGLRRPDAAFFVILALWVAILYTAVNFYRVSRPAAWLLTPYLLWVGFAAYLNLAIWLLN